MVCAEINKKVKKHTAILRFDIVSSLFVCLLVDINDMNKHKPR